MITVAFFNNQGRVGKTTLVYHLAWMFAETGRNVLAVDLDPQAYLTSMFLDDDRLEALWPEGKHPLTIQGSVDPILCGTGDIQTPHVEPISPNLGLIAGDLALSGFEDELSEAWLRCHDRSGAAFPKITAFNRAIEGAAQARGADLALIDIGPNLSAVNRSALIGAQHVVIPLAPDFYSLQGLRNLGPWLRSRQESWTVLRTKSPDPNVRIPQGSMQPAGYIVKRDATREYRSVKAYLRWMDRIPDEYRRSVLDEPGGSGLSVKDDPLCLATLNHYRSLMPLAKVARKPMFALKPADGAIGAHGEAVRDCYSDFKRLSERILLAVTT